MSELWVPTASSAYVLVATVESILNCSLTESQSIPVPASADWSTVAPDTAAES